MSTNAMTGTLGTSSTAPTVLIISPADPLLMLTVTDGTANTTHVFRWTLNTEAVNVTLNSAAVASGIAIPIRNPVGIGTLTMYANANETNMTYAVSNIFRTTGV